jgi:MOSC domain-containing protein YiiM/GNAT superfamily N-acetyltransferase
MDGRVLQVNVSPGGVPKQPVDRAWVGPLGLEGDRHRHDTVHGGPHRAVALLGIEAIERIQADGHPIEPGSVGENLTTVGIELAGLPVGTRLAIGESLVVELSGPANPCDVIKGSFRDGKSGRISILTHPSDSRMYARTLVEGEVRPGDEIRVLPPAPYSTAALQSTLERIDVAIVDWTLDLWETVSRHGFDISIASSGELAMAASTELPSTAFNRALGHRMLPNLTDRMVDFFRRAGTTGWIVATEPPWPGGEAGERATVMAASPGSVIDGDRPGSIEFREIGRSEATMWAEVLTEASCITGREAAAWCAFAAQVAGSRGHHLFVAEDSGEPVAVAGLFTRRRVGLLSTAAVLPAARGRGIQRALIAARARRAADRGCTLLTASAVPGSRSEANLAAAGFQPVADVALYRVDPS